MCALIVNVVTPNLAILALTLESDRSHGAVQVEARRRELPHSSIPGALLRAWSSVLLHPDWSRSCASATLRAQHRDRPIYRLRMGIALAQPESGDNRPEIRLTALPIRLLLNSRWQPPVSPTPLLPRPPVQDLRNDAVRPRS